MNRKATRLGINSIVGKGESFAPKRNLPAIKGSTHSCIMPKLWERRRKKRQGFPDILEDIKVY